MTVAHREPLYKKIKNMQKSIDIRYCVRYNINIENKGVDNMQTTYNITNARADLYKIVEGVNKNHETVTLTTKTGENAVLIAESDWRAIQETLYLNSIPNLVEGILKADEEEKVEDMVNADDLEW